MRDVAPEYLEHFIPYVDALLWLERAETARGASQKSPVRTDGGKKRKPARGKAG